jgi:hypothetical protein
MDARIAEDAGAGAGVEPGASVPSALGGAVAPSGKEGAAVPDDPSAPDGAMDMSIEIGAPVGGGVSPTSAT